MTIEMKRQILADVYTPEWANSKPDYQIAAIYESYLDRCRRKSEAWKPKGVEQRPSNGKYTAQNNEEFHQVTIYEYLGGLK